MRGRGKGPLGRTEPRLYTPPLRKLTPDTSYGFDVIWFATVVLKKKLFPWQEWLLIRIGELLPDGRPRFRRVLVLVARQNGKTFLLKILTLYWMFAERWPLTVGISTKLQYAQDVMEEAWDLAQETPTLRKLLPNTRNLGLVRNNNNPHFATSFKCKYSVAAATDNAGRSKSIDRLVVDELRQEETWKTYRAAYNAMNARRYGQAFFISNAGKANSVVLHSLRDSALAYLEALELGDGSEVEHDERLGIFEYSAPEGADVMDPEALAMANPSLGYEGGADWDGILGEAKVAKRKGGEVETEYRTEVMCQFVPVMDPAINFESWKQGHEAGDLANVRSRVALCADVSLDQLHATLYAAAVLDDDRVRVEPIASWDGPDCTAKLQRDLRGHLDDVKPAVFGWLPNGPAASVAAALKERKDRRGWPPPGVRVEEIRQELAAVCMGFEEQVRNNKVVHSDDPLLNKQVEAAEKLWRGKTWTFVGSGDTHADAIYAAAGAAHLARTLPTPIGKPRLIVSNA